MLAQSFDTDSKSAAFERRHNSVGNKFHLQRILSAVHFRSYASQLLGVYITTIDDGRYRDTPE